MIVTAAFITHSTCHHGLSFLVDVIADSDNAPEMLQLVLTEEISPVFCNIRVSFVLVYYEKQ